MSSHTGRRSTTAPAGTGDELATSSSVGAGTGVGANGGSLQTFTRANGNRDSDNESVNSRGSRNSVDSTGSQRSYGSLTASVSSGGSNGVEGAPLSGSQRRAAKDHERKLAKKNKHKTASKTSVSTSTTPVRPKTQRERLAAREAFDIPGQMYFLEADTDDYDFVDWSKEVCDWVQDVGLAWIHAKEASWRGRNRALCVSYLQRLVSLGSYEEASKRNLNRSMKDGSMVYWDAVDGPTIACIRCVCCCV